MKEILENVFGWAPKMFRSTKYPVNRKALRMLMEKVLMLFLKDAKITSHSHFTNVLKEKSKSSQTNKLWVAVPIKPLFFCSPDNFGYHFVQGEHIIKLFAIPWWGICSNMWMKVSYTQICRGWHYWAIHKYGKCESMDQQFKYLLCGCSMSWSNDRKI